MTYEVTFNRADENICMLPSTETCWGEPANTDDPETITYHYYCDTQRDADYLERALDDCDAVVSYRVIEN